MVQGSPIQCYQADSQLPAVEVLAHRGTAAGGAGGVQDAVRPCRGGSPESIAPSAKACAPVWAPGREVYAVEEGPPACEESQELGSPFATGFDVEESINQLTPVVGSPSPVEFRNNDKRWMDDSLSASSWSSLNSSLLSASESESKDMGAHLSSLELRPPPVGRLGAPAPQRTELRPWERSLDVLKRSPSGDGGWYRWRAAGKPQQSPPKESAPAVDPAIFAVVDEKLMKLRQLVFKENAVPEIRPGTESKSSPGAKLPRGRPPLAPRSPNHGIADEDSCEPLATPRSASMLPVCSGQDFVRTPEFGCDWQDVGGRGFRQSTTSGGSPDPSGNTSSFSSSWLE